MKQIIKWVIIFLLILLATTLIVQNFEQLSKTLTLKVNLLFWACETPPMALYLVIIIVLLLGFFIGLLFVIVERFKLKREIRILSRQSREKDKELNSLRNLPIVESKIEDKGLDKGDQG